MIRTALFAILCSALPALAGQLDVAVIQFQDDRDPSALEAAFSNVRLAKITDGDTTRTSEPELRNGAVLFSQSFPANQGTRFQTSTRIGNTRADVEGSYSGSNIDVSISLAEGIEGGLRSFQKRNYSGSGSLPAGPASIISVRRAESSAPYVVKGQSTPDKKSFTLVLVAQYTP